MFTLILRITSLILLFLSSLWVFVVYPDMLGTKLVSFFGTGDPSEVGLFLLFFVGWACVAIFALWPPPRICSVSAYFIITKLSSYFLVIGLLFFPMLFLTFMLDGFVADGIFASNSWHWWIYASATALFVMAYCVRLLVGKNRVPTEGN